MMRPDDSNLTPEQRSLVLREAERALVAADAMGRLPTPVGDIMQAAEIEEVDTQVLDEGFLASIRRRAGGALKRALSKVLGLFDANARLVFVDQGIHEKKKVFVRLHETGHASLPWQRDLYAVVEDCEQTLAPDVAELFDREANVFASEVLFQLNTFNKEAEQHPFGIKIPLRLSRKYGASTYASIRRYVSGSTRICAVVVLEKPEYGDGVGFRCRLRRAVTSRQFREVMGPIDWPFAVTPDDPLGAIVPLHGQRMSAPRSIGLNDANGDTHECVVEAFTNGYQVFVLLHAAESLTPTVVVKTGVPAGGG